LSAVYLLHISGRSAHRLLVAAPSYFAAPLRRILRVPASLPKYHRLSQHTLFSKEQPLWNSMVQYTVQPVRWQSSYSGRDTGIFLFRRVLQRRCSLILQRPQFLLTCVYARLV
jgi:hypothetical protein